MKFKSYKFTSKRAKFQFIWRFDCQSVLLRQKLHRSYIMVLLKNVVIHAPDSDLHGRNQDIFIENGIIQKMTAAFDPPAGTQIVEKQGMHVSIGWMDVGVLAGDPGFEHREDLDSVAQAAAAGGFTAIALYPNTKPAIDSKSSILYIKNRNHNLLTTIYPIGALSVGCQGKDITEMMDMRHAGAVAFADGHQSVQNAGLLMRSLQYAKACNALIINVPHDETIGGHGQMHEGIVSTSLGLAGLPSMAEELMIQRDLHLVDYTNGRLHFAGISTARSVELIRAAKRKGLKITASVQVMNLCFTDAALSHFNTQYKVMPPLRSESDIDALIRGLKDGTIDLITSGHKPVEIEKKNLEFPYADFGVIGLESFFGLANLYLHKKLTINQIIRMMTVVPRQLLGLEVPVLKEGAVADLTLFNPTENYVFEKKHIYSKSKNTPLMGKMLKGKVLGVLKKEHMILF
jgi:dihydroorotase